MKNQKDLKAQYLKELETKSTWRGDESMIKHCYKEASIVVELPSGWLYVINKPHIETRFCFWYVDDWQGKDYQEAQKMAQNARSDVQHFINENLDWLNREINELEEAKRTWSGRRGASLFILDHNRRKDEEDCEIRTIWWLDYCQVWDIENEEARRNWRRMGSKKATIEDIEAIIEGLKEAKELFKKRLEVYLKRFWLSKLHTWTYWADA